MPKFENRENLLARLEVVLGERTDDDALSFIADALDTFDSAGAADGTITLEEHERLMNEQDNSWRKRYRDTFFSGESKGDNLKDKSKDDPADEIPGRLADNPASFDELFG